jgi:hypothetical protein
MSIFAEDPAPSRRDRVRRMVLTFALVIAPDISAAGGCGGG